MKTEARRSVAEAVAVIQGEIYSKGLNYEMFRKTKSKEWIVKYFNEVGSTVCDQLIKYDR